VGEEKGEVGPQRAFFFKFSLIMEGLFFCNKHFSFLLFFYKIKSKLKFVFFFLCVFPIQIVYMKARTSRTTKPHRQLVKPRKTGILTEKILEKKNKTEENCV
jgi:hypothetical protein